MQRRNFGRVNKIPFEFGNALKSDGVNSVAQGDIPTSAATKLTINYWMYCSDTETNGMIVSPRDVGGSNRLIIWYQTIGSFLIQIRSGGTESSVVTYNANNQKTMVTLTYDASLSSSERGKFYINGSFASNVSTNANSLGGANTSRIFDTIGVLKTGGIINEYGVLSGTCATPSEIASLYNGGNGMLFNEVFPQANSTNAAYFRCNQLDGSNTLIDEFGGSNLALNGFNTPPEYFINWNNL